MTAADFFSRHERIALQFSAGKDSAACLWLLQDWWDRIDVVWCSGGNPHPEVVEYMMSIAQQVPSFKIVEGKQPEWIAKHGWPVDVLPWASAPVGRIASNGGGIPLALVSDCCRANLWQPMTEFISSGGYTGVIRGQKASDHLTAPITSGSVVEGVEYYFPLEGWSDLDVFEYLGPRVPRSYTRGLRSSLDCLDCTAYVAEQPGLADDLQAGGCLKQAETVRTVHLYLKRELQSYLTKLGDV